MESPERYESAREESLTIDELAARVGMTVRNLREWRTLGLLPPAEMRGRVGYYAPAVAERIERIQKLHSEGFTLDLIRRMLDAGGRAGDEVMRLAETLRAPFRSRGTAAVESEEWTDPRVLRRALDLGVMREGEAGRPEFANPRIAEIGSELRTLGLPPDEILDATAEIRSHADAIAALFERIWLEQVWQPFLDAGMPADGLRVLGETAARLEPLALDAVSAVFTVAMEARVEQGIARELGRVAGDRPRPKRPTGA